MKGENTNLNQTLSDNRNRIITSQPSGKYGEAHELILWLIKTIKSYRIYALNNPILTRFVDQLHQKLKSYTEKHGAFRFSIDEFKFIFDGEAIYENKDITESLPFLMHRNGLRELWFDSGLRNRELTDFLKTFRSYEILKDSQEDLVTLLWDREFSSIHFWATDDFLWAPIEIPENMKHIIDKMEMPMGEQENPQFKTPLPRWLFQSGELDELKEGVTQEIKYVDYINLLMTLVEVINHSGKDCKKFELVLNFSKKILNRLLHLQDFKNLIKILSFTKILISDRRLDSNEMGFIQKITDYLGEAQSIERVMASLARFTNFRHEELQKYLCLLSKTAIGPLCEAWIKMESVEGRMAISNALVELSRENIPTLGNLVEDRRPLMVFNVIHILGKTGNDQCIPYISRVKGHRDSKVRNEVLHTLSLFNQQEAKALLTSFLDDPEMQIRINAAKILAKKLGTDALSYLGPLILSKEFDKRGFKEQKAFLESLGKIQVPDSIRILEEVLYKRLFSRRAQWKRLKSCIEAVLASMDLDEAKVVLASWKKKHESWFFRLLY